MARYEFAVIQNGSLAPLSGSRGGSMIVLIAVGGVYVITMIGLLIYFLMALGVFEPSPIRYYPKGAKAFRIALTIGTLLFTGGLMAGSALMIVSSTEYANSLVTTGPIVDAAFTDLRNYVSNTWTQIFDETDGLAVGIFEDVQTKLTSQMSSGSTVLNKSMLTSTVITGIYKQLQVDITAARTAWLSADTALRALHTISIDQNNIIADLKRSANEIGRDMDKIITESKCGEYICQNNGIFGPRSLSNAFTNADGLKFETVPMTTQLKKIKDILDSLDPIPAFRTAISGSISSTANFKEMVGYRVLTYRSVVLKTDLGNISKLLDPMSRAIAAWQPMVQKLIDPSVSSNINAGVGIYAFVFFSICVLSFTGAGVGLLYYKAEIRPHQRKKNQVTGGTFLTSALYTSLVFSWGAMIATAYLMVYATQLDGSLCAALTGESKNFTKLRTGIRALETSGVLPSIKLGSGVNNTLDWATVITNCKTNPPAQTGINMQAMWTPADLQTHFDTFNFNITFTAMNGSLSNLKLIDDPTAGAYNSAIDAASATTVLDALSVAISNFSFSSGVGNFQKSTAKSYTDVAGNQQDGVLDTEFFTEYAKMQRLARPAMFAYPQSSNIDGYATKTAALQTKATKFSGLIVKWNNTISTLREALAGADKTKTLPGLAKVAVATALTTQASATKPTGTPSTTDINNAINDMTKGYGSALTAILADFVGRNLIPGIRDEVGRCKPVYDAFTAIADAFCTSTTPPLMGVWFGAGLCVFSFAFMVPFIYFLSRFYTQGKTAKDGAGRPSMFSIARKSLMSSFSSISRKSSSGANRKSSSAPNRRSKKSIAASDASKSPARPSAATALGARVSTPPTVARPAAPAVAGARPLTPAAGRLAAPATPRPGSAAAAPARPSVPAAAAARPTIPTAAARPATPAAAPARPSTPPAPAAPARPVTPGARGGQRPSAAALATAAGASRPSIMQRPPAR